jgi:hypothetical protein
MECNHKHLNHNSLVSQKKSDHQGCDYEGGLLYNTFLSGSNYKNKWAIIITREFIVTIMALAIMKITKHSL